MMSPLWTRLLTTTLLAFALLAPRPALASDAIEADFAKANAAFDAAAARLARDPAGSKADLTRIAADYARLAADTNLSDRSRAQAWFNAGVAQHLLGNLGDAVLAYRRATALDASIPGLAGNLARARATIAGTSTPDKEPNRSESILQTITVLFTQWRAHIFTACLAAFILTWALLALRLVFTRPHFVWPALAGVLTLALAAAVAYPAWRAWDTSRHAAIVRLDATPRLGPDTLTFGPAPSGLLRAGTEVAIAEYRTGGDGRAWVKVTPTRSGLTERAGLWLPSNAVEPVVSADQG